MELGKIVYNVVIVCTNWQDGIGKWRNGINAYNIWINAIELGSYIKINLDLKINWKKLNN